MYRINADILRAVYFKATKMMLKKNVIKHISALLYVFASQVFGYGTVKKIYYGSLFLKGFFAKSYQCL